MSYYDECLKGNGQIDEAELASRQRTVKPNNKTALVTYTAGIACFTWNGMLEPPIDPAEGDAFDIAHILDIRLFDASGELHIHRASMGKPFFWREVQDCETHPEFAECTLDEIHLLDVDEKRSKGRRYYSTTGGAYGLPREGLRKVKVRNYLDYDNEGLARAVDFRLVTLLSESEE